MIGLDTNVLVRYVMQDDPKQSPKANRVIEALTSDEPGFVSVVSIVELVWVLSASYGLTRVQLAQVLEGLLRTRELVIDRSEHVTRALRTYKSGSADFADCLIERGASTAGCEKTMTFDVGAAKTAGMTLIQ
jgi:predicted nucleic-acid-binding protein